MKTKATILTMVAALANSVVVTVFNLIYSNYLLQIYGSEINGLISTLSQFVSLFLIIEGGFMTAAVVATYKPIVDKDYVRLNNILYTCKRIYLKIGMLITVCSLVGGAVYIHFIESPFPYWKTFSLLLISAVTTSGSIGILSKYNVVLQGENKEYVLTIFSLVSKTVTWALSMILILSNASIIIVYAMNILNVVINIVLACGYEKKNYPFVDYDAGKYETGIISGTKDVMYQKIAGTVFTSTDLIVTSVFISLSAASVYNLYFQVFKSIFTLLASVVQAPFNSFGQLVNSGDSGDEINNYFEIYQHFVLLVSTVLMVITAQLIIPFIEIYTINITDYSYTYPILAVLFYSQMFAQINNRPYGTILNVTGNFKMQNRQCAIAAVVNLIVSIAFIRWIGIHSIVLGSFVGTMIIFVMNMYQMHKNVLKGDWKRETFNISCNYLLGVICVFSFYRMNIVTANYVQWVVVACVTTVVMGLIFLIGNYIIDFKRTKKVVKYICESILKTLKKRQ